MTYKLNTKYFSHLFTEAQAYCLGYFYARASGHLQLNIQDKETLSIISSLLEYDGPIHSYGNITEINIKQKEFTTSLLSLGCTLNRKYMSSLPVLSTFLFPHFLRAIFENYGRMYLVKSKYLNVHINFNEQFVSELRFFLKTELNIETKHYYRYSHTNTLQMMITKRSDAIKFLNYIYSPSLYYLERKYQKYKEYGEKGV